jgi:hypothetical protein
VAHAGFADALAAAGAAAALVILLPTVADDTSCITIVRALTPLLMGEHSRIAAKEVGGVPALGNALLCSTGDGTRCLICHAMGSIANHDWAEVYVLTNWPVLSAALMAFRAAPSEEAALLRVARGAATASATAVEMDHLARDEASLRCVCHTLYMLALAHPDLAADLIPAFAKMLVALLQCAAQDGPAADLNILLAAAEHPHIAPALQAAGTAAALIPLLRGDSTLLAARALIPLLADETSRLAAREAGSLSALGTAVLAARDDETLLSVALALAAAADGAWDEISKVARWDAVITALAAAAAAASPQMAKLAGAVLSPLLTAQPQQSLSAQPTREASPASGSPASSVIAADAYRAGDRRCAWDAATQDRLEQSIQTRRAALPWMAPQTATSKLASPSTEDWD